MNAWVRRVAGFALIPALAMLSPLIALPFITRAAGAEGWAAIATGQALGAAAAIAIQFGWGTTGPPIIARLSGLDRRGVYFTSAFMRAALFLLATPAALFFVNLIVPEQWVLIASLLCVATAIGGLGPSWYFVGSGDPRSLMFFETLPRLAGVLVSTVAVAVTGDVLFYAIVTLSIELLMVIVSISSIARPTSGIRGHARDAIAQAREQWSLAASALVSSGYTRLSVPIVAAISYSQAPVFASADRIQTLARSGIRPFVQAFQGWVAQAPAGEKVFKRRVLIASAAVTSVALLAAAGVATLLPFVDTLLFGPEIQISVLQSSLVAIALLAIGLSNCTSAFYLAPSRRIGPIAASTTTGSIVGVPLIWLGASLYGAEGALAAIALTEFGVAGWQLSVAAKGLRRIT
jgi:O-antigen/teichoic acid export membrane protein